jgi:hypothetical protein
LSRYPSHVLLHSSFLNTINGHEVPAAVSSLDLPFLAYKLNAESSPSPCPNSLLVLSLVVRRRSLVIRAAPRRSSDRRQEPLSACTAAPPLAVVKLVARPSASVRRRHRNLWRLAGVRPRRSPSYLAVHRRPRPVLLLAGDVPEPRPTLRLDTRSSRSPSSVHLRLKTTPTR